MDTPDDLAFLRLAIDASKASLADDIGGPFGAILVRDGEILAEGRNRVLGDHDPTAHAEVVAIRRAAAKMGTHDLAGCTIYSSCEPCPMCLAAIHWAGIERIVFAAGREDAAGIGFADAALYAELGRPLDARTTPTEQRIRDEGRAVMEAWSRRPGRTLY